MRKIKGLQDWQMELIELARDFGVLTECRSSIIEAKDYQCGWKEIMREYDRKHCTNQNTEPIIISYPWSYVNQI